MIIDALRVACVLRFRFNFSKVFVICVRTGSCLDYIL